MHIPFINRYVNNLWSDRFKSLLKLFIGVVLVTFLYRSGQLNLSEILHSYKYPQPLITGIICCSLAMMVPILRWWILSRIQELPIGGFDALRLTMIGYFFNTFIPGSSGGDVIRGAYAVSECPEKQPHALTVAVVDRGLGVHALLLFAVSAFLVQPHLLAKNPALRPLILCGIALFVVGLLAPLLMFWDSPRRLMTKLCGRMIGSAEEWRQAIRLYRQKSGLLSLAYLCSVINALLNVLMIHFMMRAVGSTPHLTESLLIVPLISLANSLPFTPGGIGVAEAASAGLYDLTGYSGGANAMLLTRLMVIIFSLLGLPFFLVSKKAKRRKVPG